jgi:penicillin G amidase
MARHLWPTLALVARALQSRFFSPSHGRLPAAGTRQALGNRQDIFIGRDDAGVPHIFALNLADLAFGLGVATAQDRLWQMETMRRLGQGRMAEIAGDRPLQASLHVGGNSLVHLDAFYRSLRMEAVARDELTILSEESVQLLTAFARGVNAWAAQLRPSQYPPEFLLAGLDPAPWRPEDTLILGKLIAWVLSLSFLAKPSLAALSADPELHWLLPPDTTAGTCIVPNAPPAEPAGLDLAAREAFGLAGSGIGSNSWVAGGARTASGKPILCNDPHLLFGLPALWYPVALSAPGLEAMGVTMPGIPLVLIGRNRQLAWGITAVMADDGDYYRETIDGHDRYRRGDAWHPVETVAESIGVRGKPPVRRGLRFVRHEGVLCPLLPAPGEPTSFRWVGMEPARGLDGVLGMNRARTVAEFEAALQAFAAPAQNVVVADVRGDFGYFCVGKFPRRDGCGGGALLDGSNPAHAWGGYLSWEEHPRAVNPPQGYLATANNRLASALPPTLATGFWEPPYRAHRIGILLRGRDRIRVDDMTRMQTDVLSLQAEGLVSALVRPLRDRFTHPAARQAAGLLLEWDFQMEAESAAAALYRGFYQMLLDRAIRPLLDRKAPGLFTRYFGTLHLAVPAVDTALLTARPACFPEDPAPLIESCLADAWIQADSRRGAKPAGWSWGDLHRLTFRHVLSRGGRIGRCAGWLFRLNRGPFPRPGDGMTVNLAAFRLTAPFDVEAGPSYRQVVDLGAPEESRWILAGGVSGDPRSCHYADQIPAWLRGETRPMRFRRQDEFGEGGLRLIGAGPEAAGSDCATPTRVL